MSDLPDPSHDSDAGGGTGQSSDGGAGSSSATEAGAHGGGTTTSGSATASCASPDGGGCAGSESCCAIQDPLGAHAPTYTCQEQAADCDAFDAGVAILCRSGSDCVTGDVCCGTKDEDDVSVFANIVCESICAGNTAEQDLFCDPSDPHSCDSVDATRCLPSQLLPGMFVCSSG